MSGNVSPGAIHTLGLETLVAVLEALPDACTLSRAVRGADGGAQDMTLLWMNAAARAGQPDAEAAIGRTCRELWPQMVENGSFAACMRVLDSGTPERGEFDWTDRDTYAGGYYDWSATRVGEDLLLWTLRDASDRFRRVLESEARLNGILEAAPDAVVVLDEDGRITLANPACERLLGWAPGEVVGHSVDVLLQPEVAESHVGWLRRVLDTGEARVIGTGRDVTARHRDGRLITARLSVSETTLFGRRVYTGMLHDLTARQQLELQLRQAQKMEVVGRLVSSVAHDFNNLLTIMTAASALLEPHVTTAAGKELRAELVDAAARGAALTHQLLSHVRRRPTAVEPVDLGALLRRLGPSITRLLGRDATLTFDLPAESVTVRVDVSAIEQAILNLVVNARDAMPHGGTLAISADLRHAPSDDVPAALAAGAWMRVSVRDTGAGMSADVRAQALEPFFTTKPEGRGTGLGLSSAYDALHNAGGHLEIDSVVGVGTTITLWLPALATPTPAAVPATGPVRGTETVVLMDDDAAILRVMEHALRDKGFDVHSATTVSDLRALFARLPCVHVLVSDVVMPEIDGQTLARQLLDEYPDLRVLLVSGFSPGFDESSLPERAAFLAKPFTARDLARALQSLLQSAALR